MSRYEAPLRWMYESDEEYERALDLWERLPDDLYEQRRDERMIDD